MIYFDNGATTKIKPPAVIDAVVNAMRNFGNASRGVYDESLSADMIIYQGRCALNDFFGGEGPKQVAFTKNATEALNIAIFGMFETGDHVITTEMEHNSVLRPLNHLKDARRIDMDYLTLDPLGNIDIFACEKLLRPNTKAIVLNHASNVTGNVNDLAQFGNLCKRRGISLIVDASQSAGVIPINMKDMGVDVLCFTGHKSLYGPQGTGGLIVSKKLQLKPLIVGGSGVQSFNPYHPTEMPTALEAGTLNAHGIAGLLAGIRYIEEKGLDTLRKKSLRFSKIFYDGIKNIKDIRLYGDFSDFNRRTATIAFNIGDMDSAYISSILAEDYGIATRPGAHCAPLLHKAFHTVDEGMVRFSFSAMNTEEEILQGIRAVKEIGAKYQSCY